MNAFSDELRLLWAIGLNAGLFYAAWRLARRHGEGGAIQVLCDAFLLYFLAQYAAVALTGLCGIFNLWTMSAVAVFIASAMIWGSTMRGISRSRPTGPPSHDTHPVPAVSPAQISRVGDQPKISTKKRDRRSRETQTGISAESSRHAPARDRNSPCWTLDHLGFVAATLFTAGYLAAYAFSQRFIPPVATDALVYHLPTAVQWLQTGRLGIYPTWYWNPAASYSPGTGSTFMAWWMALAGNDVLVRAVQFPPLIFIFFLTARMCRLMDCSRSVAGCIAVGAALSRPLFSEAMIPKDDLYVTSFVAAGVLALVSHRLAASGMVMHAAGQAGKSPHPSPLPAYRERGQEGDRPLSTLGILAGPHAESTPRIDVSNDERSASSLLSGPATLTRSGENDFGILNPWRVGVALGFVLASKYTVLLACPIFLFLVDAPIRARWKFRQWFIAVAIVLAMALPWYLRNIALTGNPLYPVDIHLGPLHLPGLFGTQRDQQLRTADGVWDMLANTYHSLPMPLIVLLIAGWLGALLAGGKAVWQKPLVRACLLGSTFTLALFLTTSPHHEVRYVFPLIVLWFAGAGVLLSRVARRVPLVALAVAVVIAATSTLTTFNLSLLGAIAGYAGWAALIAALGVAIALLQTRVLNLGRDRVLALAGIAGLAMLALVYSEWRAYVASYRESRFVAWAQPNGYERQAKLWEWVDGNVAPDETIAYANTFFVYPYYGFDFTRRVGYAPTRKGLRDFAHFPSMGERVPGDLIVRRMTEVMNANPDRDTWLDNLQAMHAHYLIVMKHDPGNPDLSANPPELQMALAEPARFVPVEETEAGVVFRIEKSIAATRPQNQPKATIMDQTAKLFHVSGEVQGVGFRFFAQTSAQRHGIVGYAKNLRDGRVEVVGQGSIVNLQAFESELKKGPPSSAVEKVDAAPVSIDPALKEFKIIE